MNRNPQQVRILLWVRTCMSHWKVSTTEKEGIILSCVFFFAILEGLRIDLLHHAFRWSNENKL